MFSRDALRVLAPLLFVLVVFPAQAAPAGLDGRLIVGYQGWFGCPGDDGENKQWQHWFDGPAAAASLTVEMLPSLREFKTADLCDTGLKRHDGSAVYVFSSQNPRVVARHFEWMKAQGIDGVAFQRFVSHTQHADLRKRSDTVLRHVRTSAEQTGRAFYVTYDVSGTDEASVMDAIRTDWKYLTGEMKITQSAAYLSDGGKPVLQLWGFGFKDHPGTPEAATALIADLKSGTAGLSRATVVGGVPTGWRTLSGDSRTEPGWSAAYRSYDFISPWAVGRFADDQGADRFRRDAIEPDIAETRRLHIGYMPVVFPGFSWRNLMRRRGQTGKAIFNQIPRRCGDFLWHQVTNVAASGATAIFAAMFDEVDEGTALFELETGTDRSPAGTTTLSLGQDGCKLPDDWYLGIAGKAARLLHEQGGPAKR